MAHVTIRVNLGPDVTLGGLTSIVDDLSTLVDLGLRVDRVIATVDAERDLERLWSDAPGALLDRAGLAGGEQFVNAMSRLVEDRQQIDSLRDRMADAPPELWWDEWYRFQRRSSLGRSRFVPPPFFWFDTENDRSNLRSIAPDLFSQLVAAEVPRRLPVVPTVRRANYENPLEVVLVVVGLISAGFKYGTFVKLAELIRDWSAERDQKTANVQKTLAETRELNARASKTEVETELLRRFGTATGRQAELSQAGVTPNELDAVGRLVSAPVDVTIDDNDDTG